MIRQIAALPYRVTEDGAVEVMLITSRDTGRWVVPKGYTMAGQPPHRAAAIEAWEEAGLRGFACAAPLGSYRYLKRRRRGDAEAEVTLFPLAVTEQASDWPERGQRRTGWFAPAAAAAAVTEPQLKRLIASFSPPAIPPDAEGEVPAVRAGFRERFTMLGWFQSLMPSQGRFFEQFEAHAATLAQGADALARLLENGGDIAGQIDAIVTLEHKADDITRDVLQDVRRVFVTPFDRSAITGLIGVMDDAIDQMNKTATVIGLYGIAEFEPAMRDIAGIGVEAARIIGEAVPLLRSINRNSDRLNELTGRIIEIEGHADRIHDEGLRGLFSHYHDQPMQFVVRREIYSHLERIVDRFEDVANEIQGLVIDHA